MQDSTQMTGGKHGGRKRIVIEIRLDEFLEERGRTFYWLAKETGISHTTLWRLKKGKALGINFGTLENICRALDCQPGDVLRLATTAKAIGKKRSAKRKQR
ncbi:MAG: putative transcriptional regulator [Blastocatellia bacterium]|jgi:putative transcriptional regulator|nr:putative transcriptional regulator [Blastocatellia bacterium]